MTQSLLAGWIAIALIMILGGLILIYAFSLKKEREPEAITSTSLLTDK
ncbi:hypothetical protein HLH12_15570 [Acinetobacter sp. NIPH 2377]|nr:hypothetical protein [Acinetobacter terrestris]NNH36930.1 hypothetical protein [Acinetobacter terrestris]